MKFGKGEISQFNKETAAGVYSIDVQLALRIKARFGRLKTHNYKPNRKINCELKVPLSLNETYINGFKATKCGNVYFFRDPDPDFDD